MGPPRKPEHMLKTRKIEVPVTEAMYNEISDIARQSGMGIAALIRNQIINKLEVSE